jgi:hypothetical protein
MIEHQMTCAECDEVLADFFEHDLEGADRSRFDEHVATCIRCQGLIRDIDGIRNQAADLPELVPSHDLWSGIESRIQPQVRSIAAPRPRSMSRTWLAAAAAALIVVTSSVTYVATSRTMVKPQPPKKTAAAVVAAPQVAVAQPPAVQESAGPRVTQPTATNSPTRVESARRAPIAARPVARSSFASASSAPMQPTPAEIAFGGEIKQLQTVLSERRTQLDPETVKVVEDNLQVIDTAVKRARSALVKDPASGFLMRQLDNALQKKVELLRTVALLPAST